MSRRSRTRPARLLVLMAAPLAFVAGGPLPAGTSTAATPFCDTPVTVPGQGLSCPVAGGWLVRLPNGRTFLTHGPDARPSGPVASNNGGPGASYSDPYCVQSSDYGVQVIYAAPSDHTDRYSTVLQTIRDTVRQMNSRLNEASQETGGRPLSYRVVCDSTGAISVADEHLATTTSTADDWSSITTDLINRGYTSTTQKYLVFYDDPVASYCGQGNIEYDDSLSSGNLNNRGPSYAITYDAFSGCAGSHVPMHELGHNLGAVQNTAPHTSGAAHCNDGDDVMCYPDGGITQCTTGGSECLNTCFDYEHFDCGHDTYFHANPPSGNWLQTHWNIGSTLDRFVTYGDWRQEADAFSTRSVGGSCTSATASGGSCWNVWTNGSISTTTTSIGATTGRVVVSALGDPAAGVWPQMEIYVDGTKVATVTVGTDKWQSYSAAVTLASGTHTVQVTFTNDANVNGDDRNLLVDWATIEPATQSWLQEAEAFPTKTAGGSVTSSGASNGAYWNLWSNGYVETTSMLVPSYTKQHEIAVWARGDVAGGIWPQMKVYVDGTLVLTQTVATTTWTAYRVRQTLTAGYHTLRVEFTNDGIVGSEDRNLKLDDVELDT